VLHLSFLQECNPMQSQITVGSSTALCCVALEQTTQTRCLLDVVLDWWFEDLSVTDSRYYTLCERYGRQSKLINCGCNKHYPLMLCSSMWRHSLRREAALSQILLLGTRATKWTGEMELWDHVALVFFIHNTILPLIWCFSSSLLYGIPRLHLHYSLNLDNLFTSPCQATDFSGRELEFQVVLRGQRLMSQHLESREIRRTKSAFNSRIPSRLQIFANAFCM
jgi:hypothetical protein